MINFYNNILCYGDTVKLSRVTSDVQITKGYSHLFANVERECRAFLKSVLPCLCITGYSFEWGIVPILKNQIYKRKRTPNTVFNDTVMGVVNKTRRIAFNRTLNENKRKLWLIMY